MQKASRFNENLHQESDFMQQHCQNTVRPGTDLPAIYCVSRASLPERPEMWRRLRDDGARIVSSWIDESGPGQTKDFGELWCRIHGEIITADRVVLYVEPDDFPLKGALVEIGMALAHGKEVFIVAPGVELNPRDFKPLGSWSKHPLVSFSENIREAVGLRRTSALRPAAERAV